ncbi:MAG: exo-alpha-sialidase [Bryobacterales bacterium]|nr:exo-alpha-sialidase [Bryobacterales bacterium]
MNRRFFIAGLAGAASRLRAAEAEQQPIWTAGQDGYHTYRIPSLIVTKNGTLVAFIEGRKDDARDHGDIDLLVKRSTDGGRTWSKQEIVYEEGGAAKVTIGNPCPVVEEATGMLWLPFTRDNDDVFVTSSTDDGLSWSKPRMITSDVKLKHWGWYATGPGAGIQMQRGVRGRLVIPCDHGEGDARYSHVFYSDDRGTTWKLGGSAAAHTNESQVIERRDGSLLLNSRNHLERNGERPELGNCRAVSISDDGGLTWGMRRLDRTLVEPVCQASLVRYSWDRILFSNPASLRRERMTVRSSEDDGRTWRTLRVLHTGPSGYSCLARLPDGSVGCLYERGDTNYRSTVTFARFTV